MKKIIVLRHWPYWDDFNLTPEWIKRSKEKWEAIKVYIWRTQENYIRIISSTAPRAIQTAENIALWMKLKSRWILTNEDLWYDDNHKGDLQKAIIFLNSLPKYLVLIVVTHLDFVYPISKLFWYKWKYEDLSTLWSYTILKKDKTKKELDAEAEMDKRIIEWEKEAEKMRIEDTKRKHKELEEIEVKMAELRIYWFTQGKKPVKYNDLPEIFFNNSNEPIEDFLDRVQDFLDKNQTSVIAYYMWMWKKFDLS